jgi:hypothetical protein
MRSIGRGILLPVITACAVLFSVSCSESQPPGAPKPPSQHTDDKVWTSDEVAKDPTGYMKWADAKVAKQVEDRRQRIRVLNEKLQSVNAKQKSMQQNLSDAANIRSRLETAIRRADDEERYPIQMAGRKFTKAEAQAMIAQTLKYEEDRRSLSTAYDQAVNRLKGMLVVLNGEIGELNRLREKMELDLEAVKLTQSLEDLEKLRRTEADISGYAKALGTMADDSLVDTLPDDKGVDPSKVELEMFIKN